MTREEAFAQVWAGAAKDLAMCRRFDALYRGMTQRADADLVYRLLKSRDFARKYSDVRPARGVAVNEHRCDDDCPEHGWRAP